MRTSHAAAAWILERLGLDVALAGDLLEECARGRSAFWFWKQVLLAAWASIWGVIFDHKVLALRAVATGSAVNGVWFYLWRRFLHIGLSVAPRLSMDFFASLLIILLAQTSTGWIVARTHRAHAIPMVFVFVVWLALWYPANVDFRYLRMLLVDSIDQPRFRGYLAADIAWILVPILAELAGLLIGGAVGARPGKRRPEPELS
jgi:hypothetical protein